MLMDTGLQAQGMAVALTRFRFQRRQQLFSQLLAAVLGIDIDPLHLAKAFLTEDNSPAANGLALRAADRQGDDRLRRQLAKVQQVVALRRVEGLLPGVEGGNQGGVQQIIELRLAAEEQAKFSQSIAVIKANIARLP
ncbi:L-lactate dehydrogenase [Klebsiella pneumoniae]|nr:L-lactate dehydrogenase [Klebsiella pneumoniae]